jgi:N-acyl-D-aspartate/D-glutamate deacylase
MKFELIIRNGQVVDGSGGAVFTADIGIRSGRIEALGALPGGWSQDELDASGMTVSPGFIDSHSHADLALLAQGLEHEKLRMGVTTEVIGQCGYTAFPVSDCFRSLRAGSMAGFLPGVRLAWDWTTLAEYRAACLVAGLTHNIVPLVGHGSVRMAVMGNSPDRPGSAELERMRQLVRQSMEAGAFGLSSGLIYPPACYADQTEIEALCRVAADYQGLYATHTRGETAGLIDASVDEALTTSRDSGVSLQISHLKVIGLTSGSRGKIDQVLARIEPARREGINVHFDCYPYTEGSTLLSTLVPRWAHAQGVDGLIAKLKEPQIRQKIRHDIETDTTTWENWVQACGPNAIRIGALGQGRSDPIVGMDLAAIAEQRRQDPIEALFDILIAEHAGVIMVFAMMDEKDMLTALTHPLGMIGTDAIPCPPGQGRPHPRGYGAFPRILGRYVRDQRVMTLEEAIRKMTCLPAQKFGLKDRGLVREGQFADLVVFDPEQIADRATYENPRRAPKGIRAVIVNGGIAVFDGRVTVGRSGRFLTPSTSSFA